MFSSKGYLFLPAAAAHQMGNTAYPHKKGGRERLAPLGPSRFGAHAVTEAPTYITLYFLSLIGQHTT